MRKKSNQYIDNENKESLLVEYEKRFDYDFFSIERRWKILGLFIAITAVSLSSFKIISFKTALAFFNILVGILSMANYHQVRIRAYKNALRLKDVADKLGNIGLVHIKRKERLIRINSVSFYEVLFMFLVTIGWALILVLKILGFKNI